MFRLHHCQWYSTLHYAVPALRSWLSIHPRCYMRSKGIQRARSKSVWRKRSITTSYIALSNSIAPRQILFTGYSVLSLANGYQCRRRRRYGRRWRLLWLTKPTREHHLLLNGTESSNINIVCERRDGWMSNIHHHCSCKMPVKQGLSDKTD